MASTTHTYHVTTYRILRHTYRVELPSGVSPTDHIQDQLDAGQAPGACLQHAVVDERVIHLAEVPTHGAH